MARHSGGAGGVSAGRIKRGGLDAAAAAAAVAAVDQAPPREIEPGAWMQALPAPAPGWPALSLLWLRQPEDIAAAQRRGNARRRVRELLARHADADAGIGRLAAQPSALQRAPQRLSISHAHPLGVVAWCDEAAGSVGVDLLDAVGAQAMRRDERAALARLYLGPSREDETAAAFADAWARHEARLKCAGLGLVEWSQSLDAALADCMALRLAVPAEVATAGARPRWVAWLAWRG